jgi:hypothetical protein
MSQQNIDFGTFPDDPDADAIRTAFQKVQNNFNELFATTTAGEVISVNRSPGAGIQVNSPTGNVVITANIACVQVATSSLSIGQGGNGGTSATITQSSQTLVVDINPANVFSNNFAAVGGGLANITGTLTTAASAQPNITSVGTLSSLAVTANVTAGNVYANSGIIKATSLIGTLTAAASSQPNITSVGTLTSLTMASTGNITGGNAVTANYFIGDGSGLTNLSVSAGSNIINGTSNVVVGLSGNVTTSVAGNANIIVATGTGVNVAGYVTSSGDVTANKLISTVATGTAPLTVTSTTQVANLNVATAGLATYATTANAVAGANVSGTVANATNSSAVLNNVQTTGTYYPAFVSSTANGNYTIASNIGFSANLANGAFIANTFVGNFQGNISGNITVNGANTQVLFNDAGNANATSGFTFDKLTNLVSITGNLTSANANLGNAVLANFFIGSGNNLSNIQGSNVSGAVAYATTANAVAGSNVSGAVAYATTANSVAGANVSGTVANATYAVSSGSATTAATVTTNAQPNITSVGTLSSLIVTTSVSAGTVSATGNVSGGNITTAGQVVSSIATGTAPLVVTSTTQVANLNAATAGTANSATTAATVTTNAQPNITSVGTLTSLGVSGTVTASTLVSNVATGTAPFIVTSTTQVANLSVATAGSATTAGTVTTAAQPNITSVGTLSSLAVTANVTAGNVYANSGTIKGNYFIGDGGGLSNINIAAGSSIVNGNSNVIVTANGNVLTSVAGNANILIVTGTGVNVTGTLNATGVISGNHSGNFSGNVTTAAQGNITSLGTLTGLTSNGTVNFANAANVNLGSNSNVRITGGTSGYFLQTDGSGNLVWTNAALVPVPGVNTQVIYNNAGSYGSNSNFTYNSALSTLTVPNIAGTLTSGPQTGINAVGTLTSLIVAGSISAANVNGGNTVSANFLTGVLTTGAQPNITSVGTLSSLTVTGNITGANLIGNHFGAATGLTSIPGANVTGTVANATYAVTSGATTTAGTVTTNAQPNITSVGTLSSLTVTGTLSSGNVSTGGILTVNGTGVSSINGNLNMNSKYVVAVSDPVNAQDAATKNYVDTLVSTGIAYHPAVVAATTTTLAITTSGTITYNNGANGVGANLVTTGSFNLIDTANVQTVGTRILVKNEVTQAWNGVYTWANSTTIVRATDADSYGPAGATDLSENDYFFVTSGSVNIGTSWVVTTSGTIIFGTTAITFSQFSSSQTYSAGTGLTLTSTTFSVNASQTQITSVGTLGSLAVTANANVGALYATGAVQGSTLTSTVATGTAPVIVTSTTFVPNLYVARANISDYDSVTLATTGTYYPTFVNATNGNLARVANGVYVANIANGSLSATTFVGSLSGSATTAGTVTNNAQPNITSVGTLTSLTASGNITTTGNVTGTHYGSAIGLTSIPGANVTGTVANATYSVTAGTATTATTAVTAATVTTAAQPNITSVGTLTGLTIATGGSIAGGNLVSATFVTGTLTTAAQPNITSVGTLTALNANGTVTAVAFTANTGVFTGNGSGLTNINGANVTGTIANATYATTAGSATTAGTVTTGAQPNITSVGTLTALGVNGNISAVNITATIGVFTGNGSGLTSITGANVTGTVPNATFATTSGTVTTAAQPNITSLGTLTSITSSGNIQGANIITTGYHIRSVGTGISAAGSTQGTATGISKEINIVSTVSSSQGVQLPTAVAGMVVIITNTSANSLLVYPAASSYINTLAINVGFTQPAGATIQFIAPTTTQWYTVGGTYA